MLKILVNSFNLLIIFEIKKLMEIITMNEFIKELFEPNFLERASREERQQENSEYQEECEPSEMQQGYIDSGMRESDFY